MSTMRDVLTVFQNIWNDFFKIAKQKAKEQKSDRFNQILLVVLIVVGLGYGGYHSYRWYIGSREAQAQKIFTESLQLYMQAKQGHGDWDDVAGAFSLGYDQNRNSKLATFFQLFQAQALLEQGKRAEAIALMEDAIKTATDNALIPLYKVKLAVIKLDSQDSMQQQEGLKELEQLSSTDNSGTSAALFYLGSYYWAEGKTKKAKEIWEKLPEPQKGLLEIQSPFLQMVENRLG